MAVRRSIYKLFRIGQTIPTPTNKFNLFCFGKQKHFRRATSDEDIKTVPSLFQDPFGDLIQSFKLYIEEAGDIPRRPTRIIIAM